MNNLLSNISLQMILAGGSIISYFLLLNRFLIKHKKEIVDFEKNQSKELDTEFLEKKTMKTNDFISYHKRIHYMDDKLKELNDNIIYCKWSAIVTMALLSIDVILDLIRNIIQGYKFQNIIWFIIFLSAISFIVYLINIFSVRRNDLK